MQAGTGYIYLVITSVCALGSLARAHPVSSDPDKCICDRARVANGWCGKCTVGYVAGIPIRSAMLFEEMDPHGHGIDGNRITCVRCREAYRSEGYCEKCHIGFVGGRAYMSKLTYRLAQGHPIQRDLLTCAACRASKTRHRWCKTCSTGLVGSFRFSDRGTYDEAVIALGIINKALEKFPECAVCASAVVGNGYCPRCKIRYRNGHPVTPKTEGKASGVVPPDSPQDVAPRR